MHAGEQIRVDDVLGLAVDQRLLVVGAGVRFLGRDEARAHVCEVRAHRLRGENRRAVRDRARQDDGPVVKLAHFREQRERRERARMSTGAGTHENQPIDARLQRALRMLHVRHVVINEPAVRMRRLHDLVRRAQARDLDRHAVLLAQRDVARDPVVRRMHDLIDRERCDLALRMLALVRRELLSDLHQPLFEHRRRARIQRRKRSDHAGLALLDDEARVRNDEQGRADDGQPQLPAQRFRNWHAEIPRERCPGIITDSAPHELVHVDQPVEVREGALLPHLAGCLVQPGHGGAEQ